MIVPPDRETPGMSASAWASPMPTPWDTVTRSRSTFCRPTRSAIPSSTPKATIVVAMSHRLRATVSIWSLNSRPSTLIGTVPMITSQASRYSGSARSSRCISPRTQPATSWAMSRAK